MKAQFKRWIRSDNSMLVGFSIVSLTVILISLFMVSRPNKIQACEAKFHEPCVLIAIPKSINDLTNDNH